MSDSCCVGSRVVRRENRVSHQSIWRHGVLSYLSIPLTVLWIVALTNVVNFMDGIDGVCAGISAITCLTVFSVAWLNDQPYVAPLALALAGAALGFLSTTFILPPSLWEAREPCSWGIR